MKVACIAVTLVALMAVMMIVMMVKFAMDLKLKNQSSNVTSDEFYDKMPSVLSSLEVINLKVGDRRVRDAMVQRFPYTAAITRNNTRSWTCACFGALITGEWVIAPAHCRKAGSTHRVLLYADYSQNSAHTHPILFWRVHEDYKKSVVIPKNDIALAKLNVNPDELKVKCAIVGRYHPNYNDDIEASIWRTVMSMDHKLYLTNEFVKYYVTVTQNNRCFESYGITLDASMLCIDMEPHEDCFVNEFGPLYTGDKVVGIVALQPRDCELKLAIFTNIGYFIDWTTKSQKVGFKKE